MTRIEVPGSDVLGIRAENPSPFTLSGTNTWIVGRQPAWLIDPGPALAEHLDAVTAELASRGGLAAVILTHDHADHSQAVPEIRARFPGAGLNAYRGSVDRQLRDGDELGPFTVLEAPGHAPDHLVLLHDTLAFTGDAVLGEGSVFVFPHPGALRGYLRALARLRERAPAVLAPGHGPLVTDADAKLEEYLTHRAERERRLVAALEQGHRSVEELLDSAWSDAPAILRPAATVTLAAHLDKLEEEGRLPAGVERPEIPAWLSGA